MLAKGRAEQTYFFVNRFTGWQQKIKGLLAKETVQQTLAKSKVYGKKQSRVDCTCW